MMPPIPAEKECNDQCLDNDDDPVLLCASDGRVYLSQCELERARCLTGATQIKAEECSEDIWRMMEENGKET